METFVLLCVVWPLDAVIEVSSNKPGVLEKGGGKDGAAVSNLPAIPKNP